MFPIQHQPTRPFYPNPALMNPFQGIPPNRDLLMMNAMLNNLQKINQANLYNQKLEKDLRMFQTSPHNEAVHGSKAPSTCSTDSPVIENPKTQTFKRKHDIKFENENQESLQKKAKIFNEALQAASAKNFAVHSNLHEGSKMHKLPQKIDKIAKKQRGGSFEAGDKAAKITSFRFEKDRNTISYLVEWKPREDGTKPSSCYVERSKLLENDPVVVALYYENQVFSMRNSFATQ